MTVGVPPAVRLLVESWRAAGSPTQPAMPWNRERWNAWNPRHHSTLAALPDALDRPYRAAASVSTPTSSPEAAEGAFVATMVWGYGEVGYGAFRVNRDSLRESRSWRAAAHCGAGPLQSAER